MSVEVTRLSTGLSIVTDAMPHLETASLGVWVGSGSRDERPDEHGISHLLEHMAFKGTSRRTARQIAEEIEAVGGDLNAATSIETTAYYARVLQGRRAAGARRVVRHPVRPAFDPDELQREQNVIVQEIGAVRGHAGRSDLGQAAGDRLCRSADRPFNSRHAGDRAIFRPPRLAAYLTRNYRGPDMVIAAAGAVEHHAVVAEVERSVRKFHRPSRAGARAGALRRRLADREARSRAGARCACDGRNAAARSQPVQPADVSPACSAAACRRDCFRKCASSAGSATPSMRSMRHIRTPGCSASMPAPTRPTWPN